MKIDSLIRSQQLAARVQVNAAEQPASAGERRALAATQTRISSAATELGQAARITDSTKEVDKGLNRLRKLVETADRPETTAADRERLQADFTKELAALGKAGIAQNQAVDQGGGRPADKLVADRLGRGASQSVTDVADLKKIDLRTADSTVRGEALKVLKQAGTEVGNRVSATSAVENAAALRLGQQQQVESSLRGQTQDQLVRRDQESVQSLLAQLQTGKATGQAGTLFSYLA